MTRYENCKIGHTIPNPDTRTQDEINEGRMQNVELDLYMHNVRATKTTDQLFTECVDYEALAIRRALDHETATDQECRRLAEDYVYTMIEERYEKLCEDRQDFNPDHEPDLEDMLEDWPENLYREAVVRWMHETEGVMLNNGNWVCIGARAKDWQIFLEWRITRGIDPINIPHLQKIGGNPEQSHFLPRERPRRE